MADNRYIVTHSNYTIKRKHKLLSGDTIYERDYMTTTNLGGFDSGSIPYGEGNFKIVRGDAKNIKRKHKYGNWLKNENCNPSGNDSCEYFSLNSMPDSETAITSETKIELKPNKQTFSDFAYYGSCKEMIRSSIDDIIVKFPAELYVTDEKYEYLNDIGELEYLGGEDMVVIDNPFKIDITSLSVPIAESNSPTYNSLRFFAESASKYRIISKNDVQDCVRTWDVITRNKSCFKDGDMVATVILNSGDTSELIIRCYKKDKEIVLMTDESKAGFRVRPSEGAISNFFNGIDEFEKFLLTRDSNPIYSIEIDTPKETDRGISISRVKYTWPIDYDYNLDISSGAFNRYYDNLMEISDWYDLYRVNNLWRNMTHDSIKNMDRTHTDPSKNEDNDDYKIGTTRIHDVLMVVGRFFDDMKRSIDNIKTVNTVTYDENNNTPDYFLTDTLQLSGWEIKSAVETLRPDAMTNRLYEGSNKKYNINDANLQFFRNLKLNSRALFSRKGTIEGIEMLLSLFGLCSYDWAKKRYNSLSNTLKKKRGRAVLSWDNLDEETRMSLYDYTLDEYVTTVKNKQEDVVYEDEDLPVETYDRYRKDFGTHMDYDELYGLPIRMVTVGLYENDVFVTKKYIIPWFSKNEEIVGKPYFQMFGGWGKKIDMDVTPDKEFYPNTNRIKSISGFTIYEETKKYLKIVDKIGDLKDLQTGKVSDGDIFYVNDITDFNDYYSEYTVDEATNYFYIENIENYNIYGDDGWQNVSRETLRCDHCESDPSKIAYKIMYLESLIEVSNGNNPHVGYGKYDDGETYLDYFRQIFKGVIENDGFGDDAYDCETGELVSGITNCGFDIQEPSIDNVKVWYFTDTTKKNVYQLVQTTKRVYDKNDPDQKEYDIPVGYEEVNSTDVVNIGRKAYIGGEVGFKSEMSAFNLETQQDDSYDEAAANSIINTKKLVLKFNDKHGLENGFREYLNAVILPYVKQMIPSTTIFEVILNDEDVDFACFNFSEISGISK